MANKSLQTQKNETMIKVRSLQEAKERIHSEIQNGKNYRDIAKMKFDIDGKARSFNISQISHIKSEFEPKNTEIHTNEDKADAFRLFRKGYNPADVLIETKYSFEFVKQAWREYNELRDKISVNNSFIRNLASELRPISNCKTFDDIEIAVSEAVDGYKEYEKFVYPCCECGKPVFFGKRSLEVAQKHLSKNWGHADCIDRAKRQRNRYR
ncbi:MAG: hypothetical protein GWN01_16040 [Nitrosopumilaceae archaeon]|nr:hypothetical protein [Nitrosopumilaceae archaeon]NIU02348.1 hypothetical protein [Nitrosopumilaceae archaeon]NIU88804.1 hypothetical protein [Nitrosopumilaceae archaeon]NIV66930.1 hypothetical protein [Nitrosopumilaceae archaeon]NIX62949.1 hypothetical protein [Nitrosopumilaceae archaeon]